LGGGGGRGVEDVYNKEKRQIYQQQISIMFSDVFSKEGTDTAGLK
jgi:hypothetical protein